MITNTNLSIRGTVSHDDMLMSRYDAIVSQYDSRHSLWMLICSHYIELYNFCQSNLTAETHFIYSNKCNYIRKRNIKNVLDQFRQNCMATVVCVSAVSITF